MIAIFRLINILQPLHKQSNGIHQVIFNSSLRNVFQQNTAPLHEKPLALRMWPFFFFAVHLQQVKAAAGGNPVYSPLFISLQLAAYGCDWIMQSVFFTHTSERRKAGIEIFGMKGIYLCLWLW